MTIEEEKNIIFFFFFGNEFIKAILKLLGKEGKGKKQFYSPIPFFLFSLSTFGIYIEPKV